VKVRIGEEKNGRENHRVIRSLREGTEAGTISDLGEWDLTSSRTRKNTYSALGVWKEGRILNSLASKVPQHLKK